MSQPPQKPIVNNLLSNISPPSELPSFITSTIPQQPTQAQVKQNEDFNIETANVAQSSGEHFLPSTFSAAIPPQPDTAGTKDNISETPTGSESLSAFSRMTLNPNAVSSALEPITQGGANLFGWVKDAVGSSGGILHKVAEKAKNSVDTIVTTLDPQMKDYIYSGGDLDVLVASDKDDKVRPVREAFQNVFGKATITGFPAQSKSIAAQPVGYNNAEIGARERIENVREHAGPGANLPIIAIENFIVELFPNQWYDAGMILLSDLQNNIDLKTITQMTPIPSSVITTIQAETKDDYEFKESGFSVTVGQIMSNNLKVHHSEWHKSYTSVNRTEMILNAVKCLSSIYKQSYTVDK